jgi:hypothetical protein
MRFFFRADAQESDSMSLRAAPYRMATSPAWSTPSAALPSNHTIGTNAATTSNGSSSEHPHPHHSRLPFTPTNAITPTNAATTAALPPSLLLHHLPHSHSHQTRFDDDLTSSWASPQHLDVMSPSSAPAASAGVGGTPTLSPSSPPPRQGDMMWSMHGVAGLGGGMGTDLGGEFLDEGWNAWAGAGGGDGRQHARWGQQHPQPHQGFEDLVSSHHPHHHPHTHHPQHHLHQHHHHALSQPHSTHHHHHAHHSIPHAYPTLWSSSTDHPHAQHSPHSHSPMEMEDLLFGTGTGARAGSEFGYPDGEGEKEKERHGIHHPGGGGGGGGDVLDMVSEMEMAYVC